MSITTAVVLAQPTAGSTFAHTPWVRFLCLIALALLSAASGAQAQTVTWTGGAGNNNWFTAGNWNPASVPGPTSDVIVPPGSGTIAATSADVTIQSLQLGRTLNMGGRTLSVTAAVAIDANVNLSGGATLSGGVYTVGPGGSFTFPSPCSTPARFSGLTINGDFSAASPWLRWNNVTLNGTFTVTGNSGIAFEGAQTLTGTIAVSTSSTVYLTGYSAGSTLTIAPGATIRGGNLEFRNTHPSCGGPGTLTVVNNGTIDASTAGRTITPNVSVTNGPKGVISVSAGTLALSTETLAGGRLNVTGGNVAFPPPCSPPARLSDIRLSDGWTASSPRFRWNNVVLEGTLTITGNADILFEGNQTLTQGTLTANTISTVYLTGYLAGSTLTIAPGATIRGGNLAFNNVHPSCGGPGTLTVINNGTIDASTAGRTITPNVSVTNGPKGVVSVSAGTLALSTQTLAGGRLNVTGGNVAFPSPCSPPARLSDIRLSDGWTASSPRFRWNNVVLEGTLTVTGSADILFEGNQTLTQGTLFANTSSTVHLTGYTAGSTFTIAPGATIRGGNLAFSNVHPSCGGSSTLAVTNNGSIDGDIPGRAITFNVPVNPSGGDMRGAIVLNNTVDLLGGEWDISAGSFSVNTTMQNGTLNISGGSFAFPSPCSTPSRLSGLTINGDFSASSPWLRWNNVTLNGTFTVTGSNPGIAFEGDQTFTGTLVANTTSTVHLTGYSAGSTLTIAPGATIRGGNLAFNNVHPSCGGPGTLTVINNGTIDASTSGRTITPNVPVTSGPTGVVNVSAGTLALSTQTLAGGRLNVTGGNVAFPGPCGTPARLSDIRLSDGWTASSPRFRWNNVVLEGTFTVTGNADILFEGNQTLTQGTLAASTTSTVHLTGYSAGSTLTIAPGAAIRGGNLTFNNVHPSCGGSGALAVINHGVIDCDIPGRTITFNVPVNPSGGDMRGAIALNGTIDLQGGAWDINAGSFSINTTIQSGTLNISGGSFTFPTPCSTPARFSGLTINGDFSADRPWLRWNNVVLNGTFTVTGNSGIAFEGDQTFTGTIAANTTSTVYLTSWSTGTLTIASGATIRGGNLDFRNAHPSCGGGGALTVINYGTVDGNVAGRSISFSVPVNNGGQALAGPGSLTFDSTLTNYTPATSTLAGGTWGARANAQLRFPANTNIRTIAPNTTVWLNGAAADMLQGSTSTSALAQLGVVMGTFELGGRAFGVTPQGVLGMPLSNSGTVSLLPAGVLSINGQYTQDSGATLRVRVSGPQPADAGRLVSSFGASLNGTLDAAPIGGFTPSGSEQYTPVSAQSRAGLFSRTVGGAGFYPQLAFTPTSARLAFDDEPQSLPDLLIPQASGPTSLPINQPIVLNWTVRNAGTAAADGAWSERVYLSTDQTLSSNDSVLGTLAAVGPIEPGANTPRSLTVYAPQGGAVPLGNYFLLIQADALDELFETDGGNNRSQALPIQLDPADAGDADLVVSSITPPASGVEEGTVQLTWTVTNLGKTPATASWSDSVFLSADGLIGEDTFIAAFPRPQTLGPGETYSQTRSIQIPAGVFGTRYFVVMADSGNAVAEGSGEGNNTTIASTPTQIQGLRPDLVVTILEYPAGGLSGEFPSGQLRFRVTNVGGATATPTTTWMDYVYLSTDAEVGNDVAIRDTYPPVSSLAPGASYEQTVPASSLRLPHNINGQWRWRIQADYYNAVNEGTPGEANNNIFTDPFTVQGGDGEVTSLTTTDSVLVPSVPTSVQWVYRNNGPGSISGGVFSLWISVDQVGGNGEANERLVCNQCRGGTTLQSGQTQTINYTFTVPTLPEGSYYLILRSDVNNVINETVNPNGETNNDFIIQREINPNANPDLVVTILEYPAGGLSGEFPSGQLRFRVTNVGGATATPTTTWMDYVYLSTDAEVGNDVAIRDTYPPVSSLAPGASYEQTVPASSLRLPHNINGQWRWRIQADYYNAVNEGTPGEANNNIFTDPFIIQGGDIVTTSLSGSATFAPGSPALINWTVRNDGPGSISGWATSMWISADEIGGNGEPNERVLLNNSPNYGGTLQSGQSGNRSYNFTVPSNLPPGEYFLVLRIDSTNTIDETVRPEGENNNVVVAPQSVFLQYPDLVVTILEYPTAGLSGENPSGQLRWRVTNAGTAIATPTTSWHDRIHLSTDDQIGGDVYIVESSSPVSSLAPGASYELTRSGSSLRLPHNINGERRWRVEADVYNAVLEDTGENNNNSFTEPFVVQGGDILVAAFVASGLIVAGQPVTANWTVRNSGPGSVQGWATSMWISVDEVGGNGEPNERVLLNNSFGYDTTLSSGQTYNRSYNFTVPSDLPAGDYYLVVAVDTTNQIDETVNPQGETNNSAFTRPPAPDLVISEIVVPTGVRIGETIDISWTLTNQGTDPAIGPWTDVFVLSADKTVSPDDIPLLTSGFTGSIPAGGEVTRGASVIVPSAASKASFIIARTDTGNTVRELNETNNTALEPFDATGPDLVVPEIAAPSTARLDQPIAVTYTVRNADAGEAEAPWQERVYVSVDQVLSANDLLLGTFESSAALDPKGEGQRSLNLLAPQDGTFPAGDYFIFVDVDTRGEVLETREGNNRSAFLPITLTRPPTPDLVVTTISGPTEAAGGGYAEVTWTVRNDGVAPTSAGWTDSVRISLDAAIGGDTELGRLPRGAPLAPGASYTATLLVPVPVEFVGQRRFVVVTDADNAQTEWGGETNNARISAVVVDVRLADLTVASVQVPTEGVAGDFVALSWATVNQSPAIISASAFWRDQVFLSSDPIAGGDDIAIGSVVRVGPLAAGATDAVSASIRVPLDLAGSFYVVVRTDSENTVPEGPGESNNVRVSASSVTITQPPLPDLTVSALNAPSTATSGTSITITWLGVNNGETPAMGTWLDRVYLSSDETLSPGDIALGADYHVGPLAPASTFEGSLTATVPPITGTYWVIVRTDANDTVEEGLDEGNNIRISTAPIQIEAPRLPDLTSAIVSAPAVVASEGSAVVSWRITNTGEGPAEGAWTNALYLSSDPSFSSDDSLLSARASGGPIEGSGGSADVAMSVVMPRTLVTRTVYLIAIADSAGSVEESAEANNQSPALALELQAEPSPDLVIDSAIVPPSAILGDSLAVAISGRNAGTAATSTMWIDRVYLSADATLDSADRFVGVVPGPASAVAAGETYTGLASVQLPLDAALPAGTYRVLLQADGFNQVEESNDTNNVFIGSSIELTYPPLPDLSVSNVAAATTPVVGAPLAISFVVVNLTDIPVAAGVEGVIAFSSDATFSSNDRVLGSFANPDPIGPHASVTINQTVAFTEPGVTTGHLVVCIDGENAIVELDEANNCGRSAELTIARSDLAAQSVSSPSSAIAGTPISIAWQVRNTGAAPTSGSWSDRVSLTRDPQAGDGRVVLARLVTQTVPAGTTYAQAATITLDQDLSGDFYVVVEADSTNTLIERAEPGDTNRVVSTAPISITPPDRANLVVTGITPPTAVLSGQSAPIAWRVENIGSIPTSAIWIDRVYASLDDVLSPDDALITQTSTTELLSPGQAYIRSVTVPLNLAPGTYRVIVVADATGAQPETVAGGEGDNDLTSLGSFTVGGYSVTAAASPESGLAGTPIAVTGHATIDGTGEPAAGVPVVAKARVRGFERRVTAVTAGDGSYAATLALAPTEAGVFTIDAAAPYHTSFAIQDSLVLYGLYTSSAPTNLRVVPGRETIGRFTIHNLGDTPLTGFAMSVEGSDPAVAIITSFDGGSILAPLEVRDIEYRILASDELSQPLAVTLRAATAQGAQAAARLNISVGHESADLVASRSVLRDDMVRGERDYVEFTIQNIGGTATGPLTVDIAETPWLRLVSPQELSPLAPGDEAAVTLQLAPPADLPLGPYSASPGIVIADEDTPSVFESVGFTFNAVSDRRGGLTIQATSEFSYFADPPVFPEDAQVTIRTGVGRGPRGELRDGEIIASGVVDEFGRITFPALVEGWYEVDVQAEGHTSYRSRQFVRGADTTEIETFLPRNVVIYDWTVIPIDFVDEYIVRIEAVFETNVPAPVVTIDPPLIDITEGYDEHGVKQIDLTVTNHGLITAEAFSLHASSSPRYEVIPLIESLGDIPANSSITVPVMIIDNALRGDDRGGLEFGCYAVRLVGLYRVFCRHYREYEVPAIIRQDTSECPPGTAIGGIIVIVDPPIVDGGGPSGTPGQGPSYGCLDCHPCLSCEELQLPEIELVVPPHPISIDYPCDIPGIQFAEELLDLEIQGLFGAMRELYDKADAINDAYNDPGLLLDPDFLRDRAAPIIEPFIDDAVEEGIRRLPPNLRERIERLRALKDEYDSAKKGLDRMKEIGDAIAHDRPLVEAIDRALSVITPRGRGVDAQSVLHVARNTNIADPIKLFMVETIAAYVDLASPAVVFYGSSKWLDVHYADTPVLGDWLEAFNDATEPLSPQGAIVDASEHALLIALPIPAPLMPEDVAAFLDRWNSTLTAWNAGIFEPTEVTPQVISQSLMLNRMTAASEAAAFIDLAGMKHPLIAVDNAYALLLAQLASGEGICARVTIEIEQRVAITRSAFEASLGLENPGDSGPISNIAVDLAFSDQNGNDASDLFLIFLSDLQGLSDVAGSGSLAEGASGRATWRIIPSDLAAPFEETPYFVSGQFSYSLSGSQITVPLAPTQITVQPNASLDLKYFFERVVYGDDPFTPELEPSLPFNLGLLMTNNGGGAARDVRISTAEPRIIENDRGLLIDFDLIGTQVNDDTPSPSLHVNFGNLDPLGGKAVGRWLFLSSLQGEFVEFNAEFESLNGFNTPEFSLIDSISILPLDHVVRAGAYAATATPVDDGLFDFLANEIPDGADLPDRLYQSTGAIDAVASRAGVIPHIQPDGHSAEINTTMGPGWTYIRALDPFDGARPLESVTRSDGTVLLPEYNAWQTNRIRRDGGAPGQPERFVHIFDQGGSGRYTLRFATDVSAPEVVSWQSLANHGSLGGVPITIASDGSSSEPRSSGISRVRVTFSAPVAEAHFQPINIVVRGLGLSGVEINLSSVAITTTLDATGTIGDIVFSPVLPDVARYCFTLNNVRDPFGNLVTRNVRTSLTALRGDVVENLVVDPADVSATRAVRDQLAGGLIDIATPQHVRADVTVDARVNASDVSFVRARSGDARSIGDPCSLRGEGPRGPRTPDEFSSRKPGLGDPAVNPDGPSLADEEDSRPPARFDDPANWIPVKTAFTLPGVTIRLDPAAFVVAPASELSVGVDVVAVLVQFGIAVDQIVPLGIDDYLVVRPGADVALEALRDALAQLGVYSSPLYRDDAGLPLVPSPTLLVTFDSVTSPSWRRQVLTSEFGDVEPNILAERWPEHARVPLAVLSGEGVLATANRLAARRDIAAVEPDFIMLGRRSLATTNVSVTRPTLQTRQPGDDQSRWSSGVDLAILDDASSATDEQVGYAADIASTATNLAVNPGIAMVHVAATLEPDGRAITTVSTLSTAISDAGAAAPRTLATSLEFTYHSRTVQLAKSRIDPSRTVVIEPTALANAGTHMPNLVAIPLSDIGKDVADGAARTAVQVGHAAGVLLAAQERHPSTPTQLAATFAELLLRSPAGIDTVDAMVIALAQRSVDIDGDGVATSADAALYFQRYLNNDPTADLTGDNIVTDADFRAFLDRFTLALSR